MPNLILFVIFLFLLAIVGWIVLKLTIAVLKWLAVNAITGLIIVGVLNFLGVTHVPINWLTLLILAVGGVVGAFILILISLL
ncbi:pro-sigmaK processing inhibitor BofA family protein [Thermococcus eurythermalis]|uniref:pro-sigmaK processing inhibitor BofA family protein n=1 Tax=Thermococcus eurythermalis TaxID=1505907 RepID=UPI000679564C|nr:pro-sigmaK processing inhibitor BofA family protein [Thermococcus eurythermalis]